jgi:hypothetical protein
MSESDGSAPTPRERRGACAGGARDYNFKPDVSMRRDTVILCRVRGSPMTTTLTFEDLLEFLAADVGRLHVSVSRE